MFTRPGKPQISMGSMGSMGSGHGWRPLVLCRAAAGAGSQCESMRSEDVEYLDER